MVAVRSAAASNGSDDFRLVTSSAAMRALPASSVRLAISRKLSRTACSWLRRKWAISTTVESSSRRTRRAASASSRRAVRSMSTGSRRICPNSTRSATPVMVEPIATPKLRTMVSAEPSAVNW
ncbi:hypothetical protein [Segnochrobactrum spirostomi]|uniref:Uncharacterized protein n=1 Tax=Segnochrobactrum spirostomi TaxID=2608987 RepID=A0A6A7Y2E1_9HYPH|nr:hypothetical protein [Segnochrobactrum spirostomi]MQT11922.1 hypothetical protein [Segnochrobactrum spirostomi]